MKHAWTVSLVGAVMAITLLIRWTEHAVSQARSRDKARACESLSVGETSNYARPSQALEDARRILTATKSTVFVCSYQNMRVSLCQIGSGLFLSELGGDAKKIGIVPRKLSITHAAMAVPESHIDNYRIALAVALFDSDLKRTDYYCLFGLLDGTWSDMVPVAHSAVSYSIACDVRHDELSICFMAPRSTRVCVAVLKPYDHSWRGVWSYFTWSGLRERRKEEWLQLFETARQ